MSRSLAVRVKARVRTTPTERLRVRSPLRAVFSDGWRGELQSEFPGTGSEVEPSKRDRCVRLFASRGHDFLGDLTAEQVPGYDRQRCTVSRHVAADNHAYKVVVKLK